MTASLCAEGHPSEINHGNILPTVELGSENAGVGGITMESGMMTTILSLTALRRFSFPVAPDRPASPAADDIPSPGGGGRRKKAAVVVRDSRGG